MACTEERVGEWRPRGLSISCGPILFVIPIAGSELDRMFDISPWAVPYPDTRGIHKRASAMTRELTLVEFI